MATISTSTANPVFRYPGNAYMDRPREAGFYGNGHQMLFVMVKNSSGNFELFKSSNNGTSWSSATALSRANVVEWSSIQADQYGIHWAYRVDEAGQDVVFYRFYSYATNSWSGEKLITAMINGGVGGSVLTGLDINCVNVPGLGYTLVPVCMGWTNGSNHGILIINLVGPFPDPSSGTLEQILAYTPLTGAVRNGPQIDIEWEAGTDGKSGNTPHLWVAYGRTQVVYGKIPWSGGSWLINYVPGILAREGVTAQEMLCARYDGAQFIVAIPGVTTTSTVELLQRNQANSVSSILTSPVHPQGVVRSCTFTVNPYTQDLRLYAVGTSTDDLYQVDYARGTGIWTSWSLVTATDILGANNYGARKNTHGNARYDAYAAHAGPTQVNFSQAITYIPDPPQWNLAAMPPSGSARDVALTSLLDWNFVDIDPADTQSAYALSRQVGAGSLQYWRASDNTWQAGEIKNVSGTSAVTLPTSWAVHTDAATTYKAKVWDAADTASLYGEGYTVIPSTPVNPTALTPANGGTVPAASTAVTWSVSEQSAFRVVFYDAGGVIVLKDSGWVTDPAARSYIIPHVLENFTTYQWSIQTKNNEGLSSSTTTRNFIVSYTPPATPSIVVTPLNSLGVNRVAFTNPLANADPITFVGTGSSPTSATGGPLTDGSFKPSGVQVGDLLIIHAAIRNSGTGYPLLPAGWRDLLTFGNMALFARYADGSALDNPSLYFANWVTGADAGAGMAAFRGASFNPTNQATLLNSSAQDIIFPSLTVANAKQLVLLQVWKQDDVSTCTTAATMTNANTFNTTTGDDAFGRLMYVIQDSAANITGATLTVTGGASAISRAAVIALNPLPAVSMQTLRRRRTGTTEGIIIKQGLPSNTSYDDFTPVSGVDYEYQAEARGMNDTAVLSAWTG